MGLKKKLKNMQTRSYTKVVKHEKNQLITIISRILKRKCTEWFPRCRYVQRHNNTNLKLGIGFKRGVILLTLGILEHSPLIHVDTNFNFSQALFNSMVFF